MAMATADTANINRTRNLTDPHTRLLDLLTGWSYFVQRETSETNGPALTVEELCDLYQEAGSLEMESLSDAEADKLVREFLMERVLPAVMR